MTLPASGAISFSNINYELGYSNTAQIGLNCSAVRTLFGKASGAICMNTGHGKSNTSVPGAPTGVSASATSTSSISVSFTAPSCTGHLSIDYYQAVCTATGTHSATGSSPISVTGLCASTSYTFKVRAHNSLGYGSYSSSTGTATTNDVVGSTSYTSSGCYTFVMPAGVRSISVVAVGAGGHGGYGSGNRYPGIAGAGGALAYRNNITVTPGNSYTVVVPSQNSGTVNASKTYFCSTSVVAAGSGGGGTSVGTGGCGGTVIAGTGGSGGNGGYWCSGYFSAGAGAGGAGGYSGNGGRGGSGAQGGCYGTPTNKAGTAGSGGGGGGGSGTQNTSKGGGGGGGVSIFGSGANGTGGTYCMFYCSSQGIGGGGGSGGFDGTNSGSICITYKGIAGNGGSYGGGGGGGGSYLCSPGFGVGGCGAAGAVRIVYPGTTRQFPSTCVGSP